MEGGYLHWASTTFVIGSFYPLIVNDPYPDAPLYRRAIWTPNGIDIYLKSEWEPMDLKSPPQICALEIEPTAKPSPDMLEKFQLTNRQLVARKKNPIKAKLQKFLGRSDLDKHLDADEAIALGSSLHAANLSDGIKLNRKLGMIDGSSYGFIVELDGHDLSKDETTRQLLVTRMKKLPSKMFRSIVHRNDFDVSLAYENEDLLPPGVTSPVYAVSGLADASEKYSSRNLSSPIKANMHFSLSRSGILSLDRADAVIEISEWVEVPKKVMNVENSTTASSNTSIEGDSKNTSDGSNDNSFDSGSTNASNSTVEGQSTTQTVTERKLKKQTFRVPLKIVEKTVGPGVPLSKEYLAEATSKLEVLDKDAERRRTVELVIDLEGYIYATKEKLETSEEFESISSSKERQSFVEKLDEVQDWLYTDGEDATAVEFEKRLDSLKSIGGPIFFRLKELTARPASEFGRKYMEELKQVLSDADNFKKWLNEEAEQKSTTITLEKVEELCGDLSKKSLIPLKEVLDHSGLALDLIYTVELIGGATTVPKLQANQQGFLGESDLDKHREALEPSEELGKKSSSEDRQSFDEKLDEVADASKKA